MPAAFRRGEGLFSSYLGCLAKFEIRRKLRLASPQCSHSSALASLGIQLKNASCAWHQCPAPPNQAGRGRKSALHRTLISPCSGSQQSGGQNSQLHSSSKLCIGSQKSQTCAPPQVANPAGRGRPGGSAGGRGVPAVHSV